MREKGWFQEKKKFGFMRGKGTGFMREKGWFQERNLKFGFRREKGWLQERNKVGFMREKGIISR